MSGYSLSCIFRHLQRLFNTYITKMISCKLEKMCPAHQHCNFIPLSVTESRGYIIYSQINMTGGGDTWFELLCMSLFIWAHTLNLPMPNGLLPCTFPVHKTQGGFWSCHLLLSYENFILQGEKIATLKRDQGSHRESIGGQQEKQSDKDFFILLTSLGHQKCYFVYIFIYHNIIDQSILTTSPSQVSRP